MHEHHQHYFVYFLLFNNVLLGIKLFEILHCLLQKVVLILQVGEYSMLQVCITSVASLAWCTSTESHETIA